jgi:hypothetical protein
MDKAPKDFPADIGRIDQATLASLRSTLGMNMTCSLVNGSLSLRETDPWERLTARGVLIFTSPRKNQDPTATKTFYLRPELLLPELYAMQRLVADFKLPGRLGQPFGSPGEPQLGCGVNTGCEGLATVFRIDIYSEKLQVPYADSDGDIGFHSFDTRIEFIGAAMVDNRSHSKERVFAIVTKGLDGLRLTIESSIRDDTENQLELARKPRLTLT